MDQCLALLNTLFEDARYSDDPRVPTQLLAAAKTALGTMHAEPVQSALITLSSLLEADVPLGSPEVHLGLMAAVLGAVARVGSVGYLASSVGLLLDRGALHSLDLTAPSAPVAAAIDGIVSALPRAMLAARPAAVVFGRDPWQAVNAILRVVPVVAERIEDVDTVESAIRNAIHGGQEDQLGNKEEAMAALAARRVSSTVVNERGPQ